MFVFSHKGVVIMRPIQLLSTGDSGTELELNDDCLKILAEENRPITVVAVSGPSRSGKSFLINTFIPTDTG